MTINEALLLRYVVNKDMKNARMQARVILSNIKAEKDQKLKNELLAKLNEPEVFELPSNMKTLLAAEDCSTMAVDKLLIRPDDKAMVQKVMNARAAAEKLCGMGILYTPSLLLHGEPGCGKTTIARYIAKLTGLPFIYVRISGILSAYLGKSMGNIAEVFDYAKREPCVLCLDEIDALGMARGQKSDVGEMNRVVITLMQELDRFAGQPSIIIGTTNRYDRLDPALIRRFQLQYELLPLMQEDAAAVCEKFFTSCGVAPDDLGTWMDKELFSGAGQAAETEWRVPADKVTNACVQYVIAKTVAECEAAAEKEKE